MPRKMNTIPPTVHEDGTITGPPQRVHKATGYLRFHVNRVTYYNHRVVAEHFHGPAGGQHVNHKDGNKLNNHPDNLEYVTRGGNAEHAHRTGLINVKLEGNGRAKLDRHKALAIRSDPRIARLIAAEYGISISNVYEIKSGRSWNV